MMTVDQIDPAGRAAELVDPRWDKPWPFGDLRPFAYKTLLIDPPWKFSGGTKGRPQHYRRMTDLEIASLPIWMLAHPEGCHVLVWITSPGLKRAMSVIERWSPPGAIARESIRYSARAFVWIKTLRRLNNLPPALFVHKSSLHMGHGYTTRKNAEDCLLYKFGRPKRLSTQVHEVIFEPVREHSRKPDEAHERIERYSDAPRAELFARTQRPGWDFWGDETDKFYQAAA